MAAVETDKLSELVKQLDIVKRIRELEASNEQLKASNQELETTNAQLETFNQQLQHKVSRLSSGKPPPCATFNDLPAELRNRIYGLSGCLQIITCKNCRVPCTRDVIGLPCKRLCRQRNYDFCIFKNVLSPGDLISVNPSIHLPHRQYISTDLRALVAGFSTQMPPDQPNLTRVSRRVRSETLPIFYGTNIFRFAVYYQDDFAMADEYAIAWLAGIGKANAAMIRVARMCATDWRPHFVSEPLLYQQLRPLGLFLEQGVMLAAMHTDCHPHDKEADGCKFGQHDEACQQRQKDIPKQEEWFWGGELGEYYDCVGGAAWQALS